MRYIDLHCDTASRILYENEGLNKNNFKVDLNKLKKGNCLAQTFAFFINSENTENAFDEFELMYKRFKDELNKNKDYIEVVTNVAELEAAKKNGKIGAFLSIEEGEVLSGDIKNVKNVYDKGIRIITLTWNYKNSIGYPNYMYRYKDEGLSDLGIEVIEEMEKVGIIPDASHLSDRGFYDLIQICKKPFIVTHSNSRKVTEHPRNLTDDMIKLLANKGGVLGINFCADFLGKNKIASIEDMIKHIKHIKNVGGIDVISLGSDFDGIENEVEIKDVSEFNKLESALKKEGFKEEEIEKIYYKNALRLFKETLK